MSGTPNPSCDVPAGCSAVLKEIVAALHLAGNQATNPKDRLPRRSRTRCRKSETRLLPRIGDARSHSSTLRGSPLLARLDVGQFHRRRPILSNPSVSREELVVDRSGTNMDDGLAFFSR